MFFAGVMLFLVTLLTTAILLYAWGPALIRPKPVEVHLLSPPSFGLAMLYSVPAGLVAVMLWWLLNRS